MAAYWLLDLWLCIRKQTPSLRSPIGDENEASERLLIFHNNDTECGSDKFAKIKKQFEAGKY